MLYSIQNLDRLYANTTSFYIRDLSIQVWSGGVLQPVPHGYQDMTVVLIFFQINPFKIIESS